MIMLFLFVLWLVEQQHNIVVGGGQFNNREISWTNKILFRNNSFVNVNSLINPIGFTPIIISQYMLNMLSKENF